MKAFTDPTAPADSDVDRFAAARLVADTVLYEGYVLYPYRASAQKNQMRWQFGVLVPPDHAEMSSSERVTMRTEVIVDPGDRAMLTVQVRFLRLQRRCVEATTDAGVSYLPVASLTIDGGVIVPWDEAAEHVIDIHAIALVPIEGAARERRFVLPAGTDVEELMCAGSIVGRAVRRREEVAGVVRLAVRWLDGDALLKVTATVENTTSFAPVDTDRDTALRRSMIGVHTLLAVDDAQFVSQLDPPPDAAAAVAACASDGTFPVLIGSEQRSDVMLSSPIILYDNPAIAPESAGDFCDSTEIDEILALRVMTLTDDEKAEARGTDTRAATIIDRCDAMPAEMWSRLHGAIRSLRPMDPLTSVDSASDNESVPWWDPGQDSSFDPFTDTMQIAGVDVGNGTRVRLNPSRRADAHDFFYAGMTATVKGVFNDVDGDRHVAVVLDDDPAGDMLEWQGRFLYFHPEEIEVLG